jgi:hypothetical protein
MGLLVAVWGVGVWKRRCGAHAKADGLPAGHQRTRLQVWRLLWRLTQSMPTVFALQVNQYASLGKNASKHTMLEGLMTTLRRAEIE